MPLLEKIDLAEQRERDGPVFEVLFGVQDPSLETKPAVGGGLCAVRVMVGTSELVSNDRALAKLRTLSLQNCCRVDKGLIPSAIRSCLVLQTLNLSRCNRTGAYTALTLVCPKFLLGIKDIFAAQVHLFPMFCCCSHLSLQP